MKREQRWKVICNVCGRMLYNTESKKRWDGLIVCKNDWEPKHPLISPQPHFRTHPGGEGATAARSGGVRSEPTDTTVLVCDVYTSMGVVGYGTIGCARVGSYNTDFPLPSRTPPYTATVPYINPVPATPSVDSLYLIHFDEGNLQTTARDTEGRIWFTGGSGIAAQTMSGVQKFGISALGRFDLLQQANIGITQPIRTNPMTSFCVEGYFNMFNTGEDIILCNWNGVNGSIRLEYRAASGQVRLRCTTDFVSFASLSWAYFDTVVWAHLRGTYDGTNYRLFLNGVKVVEQNKPGDSYICDGSGTISIVIAPNSGVASNAYIDECRMVYNDSISIADFTVPTAAFT